MSPSGLPQHVHLHIGTSLRFEAAKTLKCDKFPIKAALFWQSVSRQDRRSNALEYSYHRFFFHAQLYIAHYRNSFATVPDAVTEIDIDIDIFVNSNCVNTRWQWYSTHLHTNNT